jgi:membrane-associated phospholipid phosphatase
MYAQSSCNKIDVVTTTDTITALPINEFPHSHFFEDIVFLEYLRRQTVSSPAYPVEKPERNESALTLNKRLLLFFLACCIQMVYIPTSNRVTGGVEPKLPIDTFPVWSVWVLPYVMCYILWFAGMAWVIFKTKDWQFRSVVAACMLTFSLGALTFIFFPTYVKPVTFQGRDVFTLLLRIFHEQAGRYAAFPSGHVYITTLLALFFSRWYPRFKFLWLFALIIVSLSTLFTGQHYILDVIGGYLVALVGYYFGLRWVGFYQTQKHINKRSDKRIASSSLN